MGEIVRSQCRLPRALNEWLIERAKQESRSKNAQLIVELRNRQAEVEGEAVCKGSAAEVSLTSEKSEREAVREGD